MKRDLTFMFNYLLQEEASAAVSRLLSYVTPGWRRRGALRPRILDVRVAGARLRAALHDLAVFADATLANAHDAQDKGRKCYVIYLALSIKTSK